MAKELLMRQGDLALQVIACFDDKGLSVSYIPADLRMRDMFISDVANKRANRILILATSWYVECVNSNVMKALSNYRFGDATKSQNRKEALNVMEVYLKVPSKVRSEIYDIVRNKHQHVIALNKKELAFEKIPSVFYTIWGITNPLNSPRFYSYIQSKQKL